METNLTLSEAFELYRVNYRNQSAKTEEMNRCAMRSIVNFRGYILKVRVVLKYLKACGYDNILDAEVVGIPKRTIIALMFSAGLRNGELCAMEHTQIKPGVNYFTVIGKGSKSRACFIDPVTHQYIDEYLALRDDPYPALFVSEQTKSREKINPGVVQMVVKNAATKAGLDEYSYSLLISHIKSREYHEF